MAYPRSCGHGLGSEMLITHTLRCLPSGSWLGCVFASLCISGVEAADGQSSGGCGRFSVPGLHSLQVVVSLRSVPLLAGDTGELFGLASGESAPGETFCSPGCSWSSPGKPGCHLSPLPLCAPHHSPYLSVWGSPG